MKKTLWLIIAGITLLSCNQNTKQESDSAEANPTIMKTDSSEVRDGIFIHITEGYENPHRVLMPLRMATMMADDKDVIVYMDIHAVEVLVKGAEDVNFADFESAHTYIRQLAEKNIGIYACPTCLSVAGFAPEALMEGVQAAQKERFFDFTQGSISTLDY